mmetsp:Transcript_23090/g.33167  ORF Transcript_23090/g.33167 Transcript_23090/m.33167 type:complete len:185 (-) Transcript_23090:1254-1808(-)
MTEWLGMASYTCRHRSARDQEIFFWDMKCACPLLTVELPVRGPVETTWGAVDLETNSGPRLTFNLLSFSLFTGYSGIVFARRRREERDSESLEEDSFLAVARIKRSPSSFLSTIFSTSIPNISSTANRTLTGKIPPPALHETFSSCHVFDELARKRFRSVRDCGPLVPSKKSRENRREVDSILH